MSSGVGGLSRLYVTSDNCSTWKLLLKNPENSGSWSALALGPARQDQVQGGVLIGSSVRGRFDDYLLDSRSAKNFGLRPWAQPNETISAETNSSLFYLSGEDSYWFVTGGKGGARVIKRLVHRSVDFMFDTFEKTQLPIGDQTASSGGVSIAFKTHKYLVLNAPVLTDIGVVVGGDSANPKQSAASAAFTQDGGRHWFPAHSFPCGYRSCVAYDNKHEAWITVGPNGTDVSFDDGRNWRPLRERPQEPEEARKDENWTALSLPFAVGRSGKIGTLDPSVLVTPVAKSFAR